MENIRDIIHSAIIDAFEMAREKIEHEERIEECSQFDCGVNLGLGMADSIIDGLYLSDILDNYTKSIESTLNSNQNSVSVDPVAIVRVSESKPPFLLMIHNDLLYKEPGDYQLYFKCTKDQDYTPCLEL